MVLPSRCCPSALSLSRAKRASSPTASPVSRGCRGIHRTFATNNNYPDVSSHPFRSMLYVPASNTRALKKLDTLSGPMKPDAVMFDLEDGVGPNKKVEARENLLNYFQNRRKVSSPNNDYFGIVRINKTDTPWFEDDALMAVKMAMDKDTNFPLEEKLIAPLIATHNGFLKDK